MAKVAQSGKRRGGRRKGTPNKTTADVRTTIADIAKGFAPRARAWLNRVSRRDPARALDLYLRLAEFVLPKLARTTVTTIGTDDIERPLERVLVVPAEITDIHAWSRQSKVIDEQVRAREWFDSLTPEAREQWLAKAAAPTPLDAYRAAHAAADKPSTRQRHEVRRQ